jgi:NADPH2:quinone reductase
VQDAGIVAALVATDTVFLVEHRDGRPRAPGQQLIGRGQPNQPRPHDGDVMGGVSHAPSSSIRLVAGQYQVKPALPFTPGGEVAGTVVAVGDGVQGWAVGDWAVAMVGTGGFAEELAVPAHRLFAVPPNLGLAKAACCMQSYTTMLYAFSRRSTTGKVALTP